MREVTRPVLLWFRQDLRLADHPALAAVAGRPVLPVFLLEEDAPWTPGGAARWWLHQSLASLGAALAAKGVALHLARGRAETVIPALARAIGAAEVLAGRRYEPALRERDARTAEALGALGIPLRLHRTALLHEPHLVRTGAGKPYGVYTPFARALLAAEPPPPPLPPPERLVPVPGAPEGEPLGAWRLLPTSPDWAAGFGTAWTPGEAGAATRLARFAGGALTRYAEDRNLPGRDGSSGLSPHLHWGEVSPRQAWHAAVAAAGGELARVETFLKEILWREFSYHLLWHRPEMPEQPLRPEFAAFPWAEDRRLLRAWQRGRTGYPIVDAGMRQLWRIGWMHNRVRMIAASLLLKHLLQPWQDGQAWFWDTLVDADLASNSASWQWVAGSGADAQPYFRVFNPVLQGEKFDPDGAYVRRWVPELAALPDRWIHKPWEAPAEALGPLRLGRDYPRPVIDHAEGRARALAAFATLRKGAPGAG